MKFWRSTWCTCLFLFLPLLAGCAKPTPTTPGTTPNVKQGVGKLIPAVGREFVMEDMKQLYLHYIVHVDTAKRGPGNLESWNALKKDDSKLYEALKDGRYVVIWNTSPALMTDGPSKTILAYEKDAPTMGGVVLLGDGATKYMTQQEFQAAPKAPGK